MADLPPLNPSLEIPLAIDPAAERWWAEHTVEGRAVLPAVAAMQLLARAVRQRLPRQAMETLETVRFPRFLPLDGALQPGSLTVVLTPQGRRCQARLVSRGPSGRAAIVRPRIHAELVFAPLPASLPAPPDDLPGGPTVAVAPERLYAELVPLGPAFRNLIAPLRLWPGGAEAEAGGGAHPEAQGPLGAPFPLDAAMHAACAWCQRYAGTVAYPVAMERRHILRPTASGGRYRVQARARGRFKAQLRFDLWLADTTGALCEAVTGLEMRDVSGGRRVPPAWIVEG